MEKPTLPVDKPVESLWKAVEKLKVSKIAIAGGVSANSYLRARMEKIGAMHNLKVYYPELVLCTDNAAMIGAAAYYNYINGEISDLDLNAVPNLKIGE